MKTDHLKGQVSFVGPFLVSAVGIYAQGTQAVFGSRIQVYLEFG